MSPNAPGNYKHERLVWKNYRGEEETEDEIHYGEPKGSTEKV